jgi:hypothetical protein
VGLPGRSHELVRSKVSRLMESIAATHPSNVGESYDLGAEILESE